MLYLATFTDNRPPHPFTAADDTHARQLARHWTNLAGVWRKEAGRYVEADERARA